MKNTKEQSKGITLIALVITIIILLILAGLSISAITGSGLFGKASEATDKYNKAKARETLELVLEEAFIQKYDEGLTDEQLTNKINEIGEEIPKEDENLNKQQVIVDGYIFEIDRSVPKIIDELGKADGIIITARVSNNDTEGWVSEAESKANITGTIKTYSGGEIKISNAKVGSTTIPFSIDTDGKYIIYNITDSGTYTIYAEDSKGKSKTKEIEVTVKVDKTAPTIETVIVTEEENKMKISAIGHDKDVNGEEQSGIKEFSYTIEPTDGVTPISGTFKKDEIVEITVTNWVIYTIKVTVTDKCGNTTTTAKETTVDMKDTTPPTLSNVKAVADGKKIRIGVTAEDSKSGVSSINYSVTPTSISPTSGTLESGKEIELTATAIAATTYTIIFTATDNAGNSSTKTLNATTSEGLTIAQIKERVTSYSLLKQYIGTKVTDYTSGGGIWRLYYYDGDNYFGDGKGTIYLKRDYNSSLKVKLTEHQSTATANGTAKMKQMNPKWRDSSNSSAIDVNTEKSTAWLCDSNNWKTYCNSSIAIYAIGSPSVEMHMRAINVYLSGNPEKVGFECKILDTTGYSVRYRN